LVLFYHTSKRPYAQGTPCTAQSWRSEQLQVVWYHRRDKLQADVTDKKKKRKKEKKKRVKRECGLGAKQEEARHSRARPDLKYAYHALCKHWSFLPF